MLIRAEATDMDVDLARHNVLDTGCHLVRRHPEVGAIVLECINMLPYAAVMHADLGLPVYDIFSMVCWFHAGLRPRAWHA